MGITAAFTSIVLGILALAQVFWLPTGALVFGILALGVGLLAYRRLGDGSVVSALGAVLGGVAVAGTIAVVVITTG